MFRPALIVTALILTLTGCGPAADSTSSATADADPLRIVQHPDKSEVTPEKIASDVVGQAVQIAELTGAGPEDKWTFEGAEFRQVDILEKHKTESGYTLVIFMTTRNNPKPGEVQVQVSGKLQLQYALKAGLWVLAAIKNLTFRYSVGVST